MWYTSISKHILTASEKSKCIFNFFSKFKNNLLLFLFLKILKQQQHKVYHIFDTYVWVMRFIELSHKFPIFFIKQFYKILRILKLLQRKNVIGVLNFHIFMIFFLISNLYNKFRIMCAKLFSQTVVSDRFYIKMLVYFNNQHNLTYL